jgi:hypothetical protein
LHIGSAADDLERRPAAGIHQAERQSIGMGMLLHLEHSRDNHVAQILMDRHDTIDRGDLAREPVGDVLPFKGAPEQRL